MQQALYRKYRPARFEDLIGQEPIKLTLANQVRLGKVGHAYLFSGPKGTGKTTMARILAKAVNCLEPVEGDPCGKCAMCVAADNGSMIDLIEMDAASHTGVDDVREVISGVHTSPAIGKYKVYVIDEAHMLSKSAFNALLKTLEEPPAHVIFILASTEVEKFPPTIVSRCQRFDFRPIGLEDIKRYLAMVAAQEQIDIDDSALMLMAQQSGGGMRDALSLLERAAAMMTKIDAAMLAEWFGWLDWHQVFELTSLTVSGQVGKAFELIKQFVDRGFDLHSIARQWTQLVSQMLMTKMGVRVDLSSDDVKKLTDLAVVLNAGDLVWWLEQMLTLGAQVKGAVVAQLPFELMIVKVAEKLNPKSGIPDSKQIGNSKSETDEGMDSHQPTGQVGLRGNDEGGDKSEIQNEDLETKEEVSATTASLDWERLVAGVRAESPTLGAVFASAGWRIEGDVLAISLSSGFYKAKLEQPAAREMVLGVLQALGVDLNIEYKLDARLLEEKSEVDPSKVLEVFS